MLLCTQFHKTPSREPSLFHRASSGLGLVGQQARRDGAHRGGLRGAERGGDAPLAGRHRGLQARGGPQPDGAGGACRGDRHPRGFGPRFGARAAYGRPRGAAPQRRGLRLDGPLCRAQRHCPHAGRRAGGAAQGGRRELRLVVSAQPPAPRGAAPRGRLAADEGCAALRADGAPSEARRG